MNLLKAEIIHRRGSWRSFEIVEFATLEFSSLEWIDGFNRRRLPKPIGNIPPAEAEERDCTMLHATATAALPKPNGLRQIRCGSNGPIVLDKQGRNAQNFNCEFYLPAASFSVSPRMRNGMMRDIDSLGDPCDA